MRISHHEFSALTFVSNNEVILFLGPGSSDVPQVDVPQVDVPQPEEHGRGTERLMSWFCYETTLWRSGSVLSVFPSQGSHR